MRPGRRPLGWEDDGSEEYRTDVAPLRRITAALSRHLLEPIAEELRQYRDVVLMPNDLLFALPIHALTLGDGTAPPRFLADTHRVSYLTRRHLAEIDRPSQSSADRSLLAFGNPDGTLPAATQEVRALQVVRGANVRVLVGDGATKAAFKELAPQFGDLHLATHGVLDPERPGESHLVMASEGAEADRLDVREISGLRLRNALAVLSACETAVGEVTPGAALITLAGAFSQAGARSIVASLWPVADGPTRDFMVAFHRALLKGGRAEALHTAQGTLIRGPKTAHPFYWAAFILLGRR
jgi:CHAT domain-containing protein